MEKLLVIILVFCIFKYGCTSSEDESQEPSSEPPTKVYDTKFDNIDIEDLLKNDRLLKNYVKCLEYEGPCTPDGKMLREILPDALLTNCEKCSEKQKYGSAKVIHYLIDERKDYWAELERIYDPDGSYRSAYLLG
ncbi:hypothetical protein ACFFRR_007444, partial [Megaselia abdita]